MHLTVQEMTETDMASGEHVWIDVEFSSGVTVTMRLDEFAPWNDSRPKLWIQMNDETGNELVL